MKKLKKYIYLCLGLLATTQANAAGYQLQEYSVTGLGRAFAGQGIMGDDFSALAYNPAGMNFVNQSGFQLGATSVDIRSKVRGESTDKTGYRREGKTSPRIFRVLPSFFGQYKLNDKTTFGMGVYTPFGLATDYENDWFGNVHGKYSSISVVNFTPAVSYKLADSLSVGLGVNVQYASARLTSSLPAGMGDVDLHDAKDTAIGYTVGLTYQPVKSTRFGLAYRSKVSHNLKGKNSMTRSGMYGEYDVSAKITTPETITFTAAHDLNKKWTLSGTARWTRWNRFDRLTVMQEGAKLNSTNEDWQNTWFFAMGADYKYCKNLTFRFGAGWDTTAIRAQERRTARIPDERRIWTSLGATYMKNNWQLDVGYSHLFIRSNHARGTADPTAYPTKYNAKYNSASDLLGVQLQYKF
ncbi:MAG: transporter [Alphaproteobacteria bacterium]|nr:transporter [Alphaproteobacteria bacterium]